MNDQNAKQEPPKLLPCPFCGNPHPSKVVGRAYCECQHCNTKGPMMTDSAVKDWNQRITPTSTPADAPTENCDGQDYGICDALQLYPPTPNASIPLADTTGEAGDGHDCGNPVRITTRFGDMERTNCGCGYMVAEWPYEEPFTRLRRIEKEHAEQARTIATLRAECEGLRADKARLDWLEHRTVNVREPLVHGSRDLFWASPNDDDGVEEPSDIRARIDAASRGTEGK